MVESESEYLDRRSDLAIERVRSSIRGISNRAVDAARDLQLVESAKRFVIEHPFAVLGGTFAVTTLLARHLASNGDSRKAANPPEPSESNDSGASDDPSSKSRPASEASAASKRSIPTLTGALLAPILSIASRELLDRLFAPDPGSDPGRGLDDGEDGSGGDGAGTSTDLGSHVP